MAGEENQDNQQKDSPSSTETTPQKKDKKQKKDKIPIQEKDQEAKPVILIPSSVFKERNLSVLESLVEHLHFKEGQTLHQIAELLNRDDRTIWTVLNRVKKKRGAKK